MFFKKKSAPPAKKIVAAPAKPSTAAVSKAEDDLLYQKILQAFVEIQRNQGKSLTQITHSVEKGKK
jgi:hypothetical protein